MEKAIIGKKIGMTQIFDDRFLHVGFPPIKVIG